MLASHTSRQAFCIIVFTSLFISQSAMAQRSYSVMAFDDVRREIVEPDHLLFLGGVLAASVPLVLVDEPVTHELQGARTAEPITTYLEVTNELGGPRMIIPVAGTFVASLATRNTKFQEAAFTSLESVVFAGAVSYGIKTALGRHRPEDNEEPDRLEPFSGHSSYPSGHATTVFAALTPWVLYYPHPVTYVAAAAGAGGTLTSRMVRGRHWLTDVMAGAALGTYTAVQLTRRHRSLGAPEEEALRITPVYSSTGGGVYAVWKF